EFAGAVVGSCHRYARVCLLKHGDQFLLIGVLQAGRRRHQDLRLLPVLLAGSICPLPGGGLLPLSSAAGEGDSRRQRRRKYPSVFFHKLSLPFSAYKSTFKSMFVPIFWRTPRRCPAGSSGRGPGPPG